MSHTTLDHADRRRCLVDTSVCMLRLIADLEVYRILANDQDDVDALIVLARKNHYDGYCSKLAKPTGALAIALGALGLDTLAHMTVDGHYDAHING